MNRRWSVDDARRWARFSGDENPIHFDLQAAQRTGSTQLTVHGMRGMWDLKQLLVQAWQGDSTWLHCQLRLREPLLVARDYTLSTARFGEQVRGEIRDTESAACCYTSRLGACCLPDTATELPPRPLEIGRLHADYPFTDADWCFADAVLFKTLVDAPESMVIVHETLPDLPARTLGEVFLLLPVVQTHHDTRFDATLLQPQSGTRLTHAAVLPSLVLGNKDTGFVIQMGAAGFAEHQPIMTTLITLKIWPQSPST